MLSPQYLEDATVITNIRYHRASNLGSWFRENRSPIAGVLMRPNLPPGATHRGGSPWGFPPLYTPGGGGPFRPNAGRNSPPWPATRVVAHGDSPPSKQRGGGVRFGLIGPHQRVAVFFLHQTRTERLSQKKPLVSGKSRGSRFCYAYK